ncbi:hypothetical protein RSK20926_07262 [Roseobacter sp. SK209-2-6]|nr:hypothetical protein RSK20926_07262 [Roseobacter sp. SK209-2-6]
MLEQLVFTPPSGVQNGTAAAILLLRARAAKKSKVQIGLEADRGEFHFLRRLLLCPQKHAFGI